MELPPVNGLGTWKIPKDNACELVFQAIQAGSRHIDCACDYGNEAEVGAGIQRAIDEGIVKRNDLWITSKLWNTYHHKEHVEKACRKSLTDLRVEYFDAYLIHFPISLKFVPFEVRYPPEWIHDPASSNPRLELDFVSTQETWIAMEQLVDQGLTRYIGVCNFSVQHLMDLLSYARIKPLINQIERHPLLSQQNLFSFCKHYDIHVTAYSPLGSSSYIIFGMDNGLGIGLLKDNDIVEIANKHNKTPAQIILRWNVQHGCSVIPKSSNVERIRENSNITNFELSADEMEKIDTMDKNMRFNNPGVYCKFMGQSLPIFD